MSSDNRFHRLPSELMRRRALAEKEAASKVEWLNSCPPNVGRKVAALLPRVTNVPWRVFVDADERRKFGSEASEIEFTTEKTLGGDGNDADRLDCVAAVMLSFVWLSENDKEWTDDEGSWNSRSEEPTYELDTFIETVNDLLLASRVEWHFSDGSFVQRGDSVLYSEVIKPTSILLGSDSKFARASGGFQLAITRLSNDQPDVAITQAGSAVQDFFTALGVTGNSISDQLDAAVGANVISKSDRALLRPFVGWLNGERATRGNAHGNKDGDVTKADAWLAIHIAGALMVRLSNEEPRDILAAHQLRAEKAAAKVAELERLAREQAAAQAPLVTDPWNTPSRYSDETPF